MNDINILIKHLSISTRGSLEKAIAICMQRSHYNVELEHWLLALLNDTNKYFKHFIEQSSIIYSKLITDLESRLENLRNGNDQTPALSQRIIELIQEAWLIASLDYQDNKIDTPYLLLA